MFRDLNVFSVWEIINDIDHLNVFVLRPSVLGSRCDIDGMDNEGFGVGIVFCTEVSSSFIEDKCLGI